MDENLSVSKEDMLNRLKRIEGQIKGIRRMIEEQKSCAEILTQVAAARAAINKVGVLILEKHSMSCLVDIVSAEDKDKAVRDLAKTIQTFMKFTD